jgi:phosphoribosylamine--glycine ligase
MASPIDGVIHDSGKVNVLLVGGGGREHALALKLKASPRLGTLYITHPDNPGLASLGTAVDAPVSAREAYRAQQFCDKNRVGLVVIGPEDPLADGLADKLIAPGRAVFGPTAAGARIEADKAWCKNLLRAAAVPIADGRTFTDAHQALAYIQTRDEIPVIKASGLAKGKGVFVPDTLEDAARALKRIMIDKEFGDSGRTVVIEERLRGVEASVLAIVDGRNILILPTCQDHKRLGDNDTGPNTGGMGVFCPTSTIDAPTMARIERDIFVPTLDALRREDIDYRGVLFAGLMLTHGGPKVLEFNCRFGDPECQAILARLEGDLLDTLLLACAGRLEESRIAFGNTASCVVVLAAGGYPDKPRAGAVIEGLDHAARLPGVQVLHAGTKRDASGAIVTSGGRVLNVVGAGATVREARERAYAACDLIHFEGKTLRRDIAAQA